jgi:octaheme c-type cytochrome (tetrathionate reductase family)
MKKIILALSAIGLLLVTAVTLLTTREYEPSNLMLLQDKYRKKHASPVDHSQFKVLKEHFSSPQAVTAVCITCHNQSAKEIMQSTHWNWEREEYIAGRGIVYIGKKNILNNFCIGVRGNEEDCAKCHIGYGISSKGLSITDPRNIDCLVCHDTTETYAKAEGKGGAPVTNLDFNYIAENVGRPKRSDCGVCHFYGGGGNNVKHGDLESAMFDPVVDTDIHMGTDGPNLVCVDCHETEKHNISGKLYSLSSMNHHRTRCEQCHTETPHDDDLLNEHTLKVACQTCHIPTYAKVNATKTFWDWSTAGKLKNGQPYSEDDSLGNHTYLSIKGSFTWGKNLQPDYIWFDGTTSHYLSGDIINDTTRVLMLNTLHGSYQDAEAKIIPVKIHWARQPFDPVNKILIQPKLFAERKGEGAFWEDFDWQKASAAGMKELKLPFSGKVSFIKTGMYWPVNHMVSLKDKSVTCSECHTRTNSRLAQLTDFYLPGRDYSATIEITGKILLFLTVVSILIHGSLRLAAAVRIKNRGRK